MSDVHEFAASEGGPTAPNTADGLRRLAEVRVELSVEIGRTEMSLGEALGLGPGSVIGLDRMADEPVDLLVNGKLVARGEVVVVDSEYGLRVTQVVGAEPRPPEFQPVLEAAPVEESEAEETFDQAAIEAAIAAASRGEA